MITNDILAKFQSNNSKLESVLYKKKLSGDVKNLLLNMLYRITTSYNDYANVKVNVEDKNKFVQNIIDIIDKCEDIELIKQSSEKGQDFIKKGITSEVDTYLKTIKVFQSEKDMLFALFKMNDTKMYIDEKYNLIRVAFPEMMNEGRDINNIEIIRDFNAWSWNTIPSEISNITCNLIYQNLQILLGYEFLDNLMKKDMQAEIIKKLEEKLKSYYAKAVVDDLLNNIYKLSVIICTERNKNEKTRLIEEMEWEEKELERLKNKPALVEELTKIKKDKAKEIKKLDEIISSNDMLLKEFEKRNKKLSEYKKIYSPETLLGTLKKERKKALNEIDEANKLLDAKFYVAKKAELESDLNLLSGIKKPSSKEKYKIAIQKLFISCMNDRIKRITSPEQKREAIALLSIIRYYNFIPFDEKRFIGDVEEISSELEELEGKMLLKLYDIKAINQITKDIQTDIGIIRPIFKSRIMDIKKINIYAENKSNKIIVNIYDSDILEMEFTIDNFNNIDFKSKKKIKLISK